MCLKIGILLPFHCVNFKRFGFFFLLSLYERNMQKVTRIMIKTRGIFFSATEITYCKVDDCFISISPVKNLDYGTKALNLSFASLFH